MCMIASLSSLLRVGWIILQPVIALIRHYALKIELLAPYRTISEPKILTKVTFVILTILLQKGVMNEVEVHGRKR
jgi:hypothetical protein